MLLITWAVGCTEDNKLLKNKGFEAVPAIRSGIQFGNTITLTDSLNYNTFPYIYMGGGVAMGDINNDNLTDVFLTGNMVSNKLYLNKGDLTFKDISADASISGDSRWYTGVTMVDINTDGWLDIYVSVSGKYGDTQNQLFVNNGASSDSDEVRFTEMAADFGIADSSNSIQSTFFDFDNDGDLDLYVANYPVIPLTMPNAYYYEKMQLRDYKESGHLFRNEGNGKFNDVTEEAGLLNFGLSLGVVAGDFNNDGWKDLYISNDFNVPDYFYINNGDGTFKERLKETTRQTAMFGMGVDAADFNNDGLLDLVQVDMTPNDHYRSKTNMASMNPQSFYDMVDKGFHYQYMQNSLQVNNGTDSEGMPILSNVARLTGIATTDWSWAPLFADFDNDGLKDIIITNGMRLDVNNNDLLNTEKVTTITRPKIDMYEAPSTPVENFLFRNKGNFEFEDVSKQWNANIKGFSNGVAYGDLDNDGDLDMVLNNLDDTASLLRNNSEGANYLKVKLKGSKNNPMGIGAKIKVVTGDVDQWVEHTLTKGFQSSIDPIVHFGLGQNVKLDTIKIFWTDGKTQILTDMASNQTLEVLYDDAVQIDAEEIKSKKPFADITIRTGLDFIHTEDSYDDFRVEPLLPHKNSELGPALAKGDVNGDGLEDIFIGNAKNSAGAVYLQDASGTFETWDGPWIKDQNLEDTGAVFFDADNDKDLDLYVVSGGNDAFARAGQFQDRLYLNTPGGFVKSNEALPEITSSGLKVLPIDYDSDGDMDLFVGGRIQPGRYLQPPQSYILENTGGRDESVRFSDVTSIVAPELANIGMVTDALWFDYDDDGIKDLILAGEWMPVTFFKNDNGHFVNVTEEAKFEHTVGWWNCLKSADFDNDGDLDIVAGNLGLNSKYKSSEKSPFEIYVNDFDENKRQDIVLSVTKKGAKLPLRGRECSSQQIPMIKKNFETYASFASASLEDIYGKDMLDNSIHKTIDTFAHHWFENKGKGNFQMHELPIASQFSTINAIAIFDYNNDGFSDMLVAGNAYDAEVETPRWDASIGLVLENNRKKGFKTLPLSETGLLVNNEVKLVEPFELGAKGEPAFVMGINNDSLQVVSFKPKGSR